MQLRSGATLGHAGPATETAGNPHPYPGGAPGVSTHPSAPHAGGEGAPPGAPGSSEERAAAFREGVRLCLGQWTALQLAVEQQWGGRHSARKAQELGDDIWGWFASRAHKRTPEGNPLFYADELEDILDETVLNTFNMEVEDGSLEEVSNNLMQVHEECWVGDYTSVLRWQQEERARLQSGRGGTAAASLRQQTGEEEDDDSDDSMDGDMSTGGAGLQGPPQGAASSMGVQGVPEGGPDKAHAGASSMGGVQGLGAGGGESKEGALTQDEMDEGWQEVGTRRSGRRR